MKNGKYRVLLLIEHPVQYYAYLWKAAARHPRLDLLVAFCSLRGAIPALNPDFGIEIKWDTPLLEGYPWILLPSTSDNRNTTARPGLFSKTLWQLVTDGRFDAVYVGGYYFREAWTAILAARRAGVPLIISTEIHALESRRVKSRSMRVLKRWIVGRIFRMADAVITSSSGASAYVASLGVPDYRIRLGGNTVDNQWWKERAARVDRAVARETWNIPSTARVVAYCAKLQPWKRPGDLLMAFNRANVKGSYLVFAGDGPLRAELENDARKIGIAERVRFLGFVNQMGLPQVYASSDVLVLPSDYEPFGVVVNEAMLCGCPAIISDRVGAKYDLVRDGKTGYVYPCADVDALAGILRCALGDLPKLAEMSRAASARMDTWTPEMTVEAMFECIEVAVRNKFAAVSRHVK